MEEVAACRGAHVTAEQVLLNNFPYRAYVEMELTYSRCPELAVTLKISPDALEAMLLEQALWRWSESIRKPFPADRRRTSHGTSDCRRLMPDSYVHALSLSSHLGVSFRCASATLLAHHYHRHEQQLDNKAHHPHDDEHVVQALGLRPRSEREEYNHAEDVPHT